MNDEHRPAMIAQKDGSAPDRKKVTPGSSPRVSYRPPVKPSRPKLLLPIIVLVVIGVLLLQNKWVDKNKDKFLDPLVAKLFGQVFRAQYIPIQCPHCEGSGRIEKDGDADQFASCPVCFGVGVHHVRLIGGYKVLCPGCHGMGRHMDASSDISIACTKCGGRGLLQGKQVKGTHVAPAHILQIECDECTGSGYVQDPNTHTKESCPVCFALGYHWTRKTGDQDMICAACGGMGRIMDPATREVHECKRCSGRGLIESKTPHPTPEEN